jgi:ABC-2 type transport system ATP-binding protein
MDAVVFEAVTKIFRDSPGLIPWRPPQNLTTALCDVTFSVPAGKVLALLGPNGSGKTTLLKLVSTMLLPDRGRVLVRGADTVRDAEAVRRSMAIAVANERSFFPRLTARENLQFFATLEDVSRQLRDERIFRVLDTLALADSAGLQVMKFSSGMYQRLGIARALLKQPSVLLLDEPTRSLDPNAAPQFWALVRDLANRGCTVLMATHNFDEAFAVADIIAVLRSGELAELWDVEAVRGVEDLRARYFRTTGEYDLVSELRSRCTS